MPEYQVLFNTCPDLNTAQDIAKVLLEKHLAACINIVPQIQSMYEWKGEIVTDTELLLIIKTQAKHYASIEKLLMELHPYEVPELIALPINAGLPSYLDWIQSVTEKDAE
ncbi:divalent-cation tolerance protein CutA [Candidatus Albibeggiatoa sp. nov. NOAA]|uniref:divalent-cation tolerance protein CutA n=1 Tax=Candidatus Albibeggiatoa sp. nov. NOAA TaxID=3162724 RepID=UPI0032FA6210|nr:divalent-cation tolerance protein CutA [Thiotrichaceae bacterium]